MERGGRRPVHRPGGSAARPRGPAEGGGVRLPAQPDGHGLGRGGPRDGLPPRSHAHGCERRAADADGGQGEPRAADGLRSVEGRGVQRARGVRLLRHPFRESPRHAPSLPARRLGGPPAAQGLRPGAQPAADEQRGGRGYGRKFRADARRKFHPPPQADFRGGRVRDKYRSPAPGDARRAAFPRRARRRDHPQARRALRLHPPRYREDVRGA